MEETTQTCPDCHALVADLEAHETWHRRLVHDLALAVKQDADRRARSAPA
jgi:hypothetical protein